MAMRYIRSLSAANSWGFGPRDVLISGQDEDGNSLFLDLDIKGARALLEELTKAVTEAEQTEAAYQRDMVEGRSQDDDYDPLTDPELFNEFSAGAGVNIE